MHTQSIQVNDETVQRFKDLYERKYKKEISDTQAHELATFIIRFVYHVHKAEQIGYTK